MDDEDDNDYYQLLYKNGELYEDKVFGKITLRPRMIFMNKAHFKDHLRITVSKRALPLMCWLQTTQDTQPLVMLSVVNRGYMQASCKMV